MLTHLSLTKLDVQALLVLANESQVYESSRTKEYNLGSKIEIFVKKHILINIIRIFSFSKCDCCEKFCILWILARDMITMLQVLCHIFHDAGTNWVSNRLLIAQVWIKHITKISSCFLCPYKQRYYNVCISKIYGTSLLLL